MSYSFFVRAATVAAAVAAVPAKFDEVVGAQPVHAKDREAAESAATSIAQLVGEPAEGQEVQISVSGWVQWATPLAAGDVPDELTGASVSVQVSHIAKTE